MCEPAADSLFTENRLTVLLLMAVFAKTLLPLVGGHLMAFTFFAARHNGNFFWLILWFHSSPVGAGVSMDRLATASAGFRGDAGWRFPRRFLLMDLFPAVRMLRGD